MEQEFFAIEGSPADYAPVIREVQALRLQLDEAIGALQSGRGRQAQAMLLVTSELMNRLLQSRLRGQEEIAGS